MFSIILATGIMAFSPSEIIRTPVDSLQIDNYIIIKYQIPKTFSSSGIDEYQFDFEKQRVILRSTISDPFINIYRCFDMKGDCDFVDLNCDGFRDVIIIQSSGGTNGAEDVYIYSLDSTTSELASFKGMDKYLAFYRDIDKDCNIEIFFRDIADYGGYPEGTEVIPYYRVYKWDGTRFRVANFLLKKEISRLIFGQIPDSIDIESYDRFKVPGNYEYKSRWTPEYPIGLSTAITSLYFIGEYSLADSIFERCWPDSISGKAEFIGKFKKGVHGEFRKDILESDWK